MAQKQYSYGDTLQLLHTTREERLSRKEGDILQLTNQPQELPVRILGEKCFRSPEDKTVYLRED
jgi:hypothetical protein